MNAATREIFKTGAMIARIRNREHRELVRHIIRKLIPRDQRKRKLPPVEGI